MKELLELAKRYWLSMVLCGITLLILKLTTGYICPSIILFGIPCPTCGITRATKLMLTGHIHEALQMHPLLLLVIFGVFLYIIIKRLLNNYRFYIKLYVIICLLIFIGFYIFRMVTYFPNVEPMLYYEDNYLSKIFATMKYMKQ